MVGKFIDVDLKISDLPQVVLCARSKTIFIFRLSDPVKKELFRDHVYKDFVNCCESWYMFSLRRKFNFCAVFQLFCPPIGQFLGTILGWD